MATGTIKNQHTGTWTEVNTNLKYQVRSGIVFVWVKASAAASSWTVIGTLPSGVSPEQDTDLAAYSASANYYVATDGRVFFFGTTTAPVIFSYPLP